MEPTQYREENFEISEQKKREKDTNLFKSGREERRERRKQQRKNRKN